jgi:putative flippase GtrA
MTVREHTHPASLLVRRLTRFVGIGVVNTLLDLALYALLEPSLGLLPATIVSTGCAMVFSYVANAFLAFGATRLSWRSAVQFFGLSALNLWIVQPVVIWLLDRVLHSVVHDDYHRALLAKLAATAVSMTLNFLVYDRYIWPRTSVAQPQDGPATP